MILVDTSVWIDHLRSTNAELAHLLRGDEVLMHPFVLGEISCGNLPRRAEILSSMHLLPIAKSAEQLEVLNLVEQRRLWGRGIGWIDVHLLASALLTGCQLWTLDESLHKTAASLSLAWV